MRRPLMKCFGSKWRLASRYPAVKYPLIIEPFARSASFSCRMHDGRVVVLNDLDADIMAAWQWLRAAAPSEVRGLPVDVPEGTDIRTLGLPRGAAVLMRLWQRVGRNDCWATSSWNNTPMQWSHATLDSIAGALAEIREWVLICGDYRDLPNTPATWFIDPPYQAQGKVYPHWAVDYVELADWCRSRKGQVIVCEQAGADWLPFTPLANMGRLANRTGARHEVYWAR
jgi:hypothetical protein